MRMSSRLAISIRSVAGMTTLIIAATACGQTPKNEFGMQQLLSLYELTPQALAEIHRMPTPIISRRLLQRWKSFAACRHKKNSIGSAMTWIGPKWRETRNRGAANWRWCRGESAASIPSRCQKIFERASLPTKSFQC